MELQWQTPKYQETAPKAGIIARQILNSSREVVITITAGDLGITGLEAWYFDEKTVGNIELKISDIFSRYEPQSHHASELRARILGSAL